MSKELIFHPRFGVNSLGKVQFCFMGFGICRIVFFLEIYMGVSENRGIPKWMVKIMEHPINPWMIWGYHFFLDTPI